jgi:hypothetical protein
MTSVIEFVISAKTKKCSAFEQLPSILFSFRIIGSTGVTLPKVAANSHRESTMSFRDIMELAVRSLIATHTIFLARPCCPVVHRS